MKAELYQRVREDPAIFNFFEQGSLDGIWYWDLERTDQEWLSPRFKATFGYAEDEMDHSPEWWQRNIHPDDLEVALANFDAHVADPTTPYDQVVRYRNKAGSTVWVRCRGLVIRDDEGKPIRMLGAHTDVTALKQAQEALARTNADLAHANHTLAERNRALEQLAYLCSHDLRAPLRSILGFGEAMMEEVEDGAWDEAVGFARHMVQGAERLRKMLEGLLELSRLQAETGCRSHDEPVDLGELVKAAELDVRKEASSFTVAGVLPTVRGTRPHLDSLVGNILDNAVKYRS
ncbi:MAG: PAS domain-containing sensor histidine kinase, partial [Myxococcota bacterium]